LEGLPPGVIPTSTTGVVSYIGNGNWNVDPSAVPTLQIPAAPNYSGEDPYPELILVAAVQELDGDQAVSDPWDIDFEIAPDVDGFSQWKTFTEVVQGAIGGLPLNAALDFTLADDDGSEEVISVSYDLSSVIQDAGISAALAGLTGGDTSLDQLVNNYVEGDFQSFDSSTGILTATLEQAGTLSLAEELFVFSNQDFSIPISLLIRDSAEINGNTVVSEKTEQENLFYGMVGVAEIPTVFADDASGLSLSFIPVNLGGESTDEDVLFGREASESIYYIITDVQNEGMPFNYAVSLPLVSSLPLDTLTTNPT
jgi:hypothetical protein